MPKVKEERKEPYPKRRQGEKKKEVEPEISDSCSDTDVIESELEDQDWVKCGFLYDPSSDEETTDVQKENQVSPTNSPVSVSSSCVKVVSEEKIL